MLSLRKRTVFIAQLLAVSSFFHLAPLIILYFLTPSSRIVLSVFADKEHHDAINIMWHSRYTVTQKNDTVPAQKVNTVLSPTAKTTLVAAQAEKKKNNNEVKPPVKKMDEKKTGIESSKPVEKKNTIQSTPVKGVSKKTVAQKAGPDSGTMSIGTHMQQGSDDDTMYLLSKAVRNQWRPPAGLAKNLECVIKVIIDSQGETQNIIIEKSSTIITYDIAARRALTALSFPPSLYGREMLITFKQ